MSTPINFARRDGAAPELRDRLESLERTLEQQLAAATSPEDHVATAHRAGVERTLEEVRLSLRLTAEGRYGTCVRCADPISAIRLEARPWATRCIGCSQRFGW